MLTNITKLENGTYVLKRDVENSNADGGTDVQGVITEASHVTSLI